MTTPFMRAAAACLVGATAVALLSGFDISQYNLRNRQFPNGQPHLMVYRNLTKEQMNAVMKEISDGIGVKCSYCHDEKDYASEKKPEKDFARTKLFMLEWVNARYRPNNAAWHYTCWGCHRGHVLPVPQTPEAAKKP